MDRCWLNNQDVIRIGGETMLRFSLLSANEIEFMEKMYEAAVLDPLTRIYNRRYFFGLLHQYIEKNMRAKQRLALIIIDIDHFKILNDTYGHQVGDFALRHVSSLICLTVRAGDKVCRFGGEEFTILLNEVDLPEATSIAERIRATVEDNPLLYEGAVIPMTVSIGVATLDHAFGSPDRLFALADARMYEAKNAGRNQVCNGPVALPR
ncbi:GGDEF domain-containing protein [Azospirillum humicireducens]|nr:GGDEF domain-containing protein [Azospirillum humicireducens]